jgi:hypothetical protein
MSQGTDVVAYAEKIGALSLVDIKAQVNLIQHVMKEVMQENQHYGIIPGTGTKPTLLKAGAEKLCLTFRLDPQYEIEQKQDGKHLTIMSKCTLWHIPSGQRYGSGMGSCSTLESKYAYRTSARKCPNCGSEAIIKGKEEYGGGWICFVKKGGCGAKFLERDEAITAQTVGRAPNEDVADQYNTVLKMANKRSLVAAVLNATAASDIFTQDIEDMPEFKPADERPAGGAQPSQEQPDSPPASQATSGPTDKGAISPSQERLIRAKLSGASLTEVDFSTKYPTWSLTPKAGKVLVPKGEVNNVLAWIDSRAA